MYSTPASELERWIKIDTFAATPNQEMPMQTEHEKALFRAVTIPTTHEEEARSMAAALREAKRWAIGDMTDDHLRTRAERYVDHLSLLLCSMTDERNRMRRALRENLTEEQYQIILAETER